MILALLDDLEAFQQGTISKEFPILIYVFFVTLLPKAILMKHMILSLLAFSFTKMVNGFDNGSKDMISE
jgi:hypothetical protein